MDNHENDVPNPLRKFPFWEIYPDPFGIRKTTLGGDEPGLQAETDWLNRPHKVNANQKTEDDK